MQTDLINQGVDTPQFSEDSNQPAPAEPAAQPASLPSSQSNIADQNPEPYVAQPEVPGISNIVGLKKKLCYPMLFLWIICLLLLIDFFYVLVLYDTPPVLLGISCLTHFTVAHIISKSAKTCDIQKYENALGIYIAFFTIITIFHLIAIFRKNNKFSNTI